MLNVFIYEIGCLEKQLYNKLFHSKITEYSCTLQMINRYVRYRNECLPNGGGGDGGSINSQARSPFEGNGVFWGVCVAVLGL